MRVQISFSLKWTLGVSSAAEIAGCLLAGEIANLVQVQHCLILFQSITGLGTSVEGCDNTPDSAEQA